MTHIACFTCADVLYSLPKLPNVYSFVSTQISSDVTWERSLVPHSNSYQVWKRTPAVLLNWILFLLNKASWMFTSDLLCKAFDDNYFICAFHLETSICGVCPACSLLFTGSTVHSGQFDRMILSKHVQNCILWCITYLWNLISLQACSMWSLDHSLHRQHGISYIYVSIAAVNEMKR